MSDTKDMVNGASTLMRSDIELLTELASRGNEGGLILHIIYLKGMLQMLEWSAGDDARELIAFVTRCCLDAMDECKRIMVEHKKGIFQ